MGVAYCATHKRMERLTRYHADTVGQQDVSMVVLGRPYNPPKRGGTKSIAVQRSQAKRGWLAERGIRV